LGRRGGGEGGYSLVKEESLREEKAHWGTSPPRKRGGDLYHRTYYSHEKKGAVENLKEEGRGERGTHERFLS